MINKSLTTRSLIALVAGLGLGLIGHHFGGPVFEGLAAWVKPLGALWVAALQLTVLPLIVTHLLAAICNAGTKSVGKAGVRALFIFIVLLVASGTFAVLLAKPIVARLPVDATTLASLASAAPTVSKPETSAVQNTSLSEWIGKLLPTNILDAGVRGDIFPILLFTAFFGLAVTRLPPERSLLLTNVFQGLADAMLELTSWVLVVTPLGVFALTYVLAFTTGGAAGGMLGAYIVIASVLMILFTLLLYPLTALLGKTRIVQFARGVAPAQLLAISTRSSIAALPALVKGGVEHLHLPAVGTSFVLPLSVSVFKVNRPISSVVKLMLVAHVYGVPLRPGTLVIFVATVILLSFTAAGIPQSGPGLKTLPAYLAAGVPIEGILVLEAVETIPDIFKTLLNVTGDMSAAVLLTRAQRGDESEVATIAEPAPAESVL